MAASEESAELRSLLEDSVTGTGLELESVVLNPRTNPPLLTVTVDAPEGSRGVDSDTLAEASRAVSATLDKADPIDSEYLLEVSTPGAERELTEPRHWRREIGRLIRVKLREGGTVTGRLTEATDETATLKVDGEPTTISYAHVKKARPRVEFGSKE